MGTHREAQAFPAAGVSGLSKREFVAAKVLAALAPREDLAAVVSVDGAGPGPKPRLRRWAKGLASLAVLLADALLDELQPDHVVAGDGPAAEEPHWERVNPNACPDDTVSFDPQRSAMERNPDSGVDLDNCGAEGPP